MSESTEFDANYGSGNMAKSGSGLIFTLDGMMRSVYAGSSSPAVFLLSWSMWKCNRPRTILVCFLYGAGGCILVCFLYGAGGCTLGLPLRFTLVKSFGGRELPDVSY